MAALGSKTNPTRADLEQAAIRFFAELAAELEQPRKMSVEHFDEEINFNVEESRRRIDELDHQIITGVFDASVEEHAKALAASVGSSWQSLPNSEQRLASRLAARADREQLRLLIHGLTRPVVHYEHVDRLFSRPSTSPPASTEPTGIGVQRLSLATKEYLARRVALGRGKSQIEETRRVFGWLEQRLGADRALDTITKSELRAFRDDVERLSASHQGRATMFEERLSSDPQDRIAWATASRYWRYVQAFFAWVVAEKDLDSNPAEGLKIEKNTKDVKRSPRPFTPQELQTLFNTPLFAGYKSLSRLGESGQLHRRLDHWWSAILMMYTGLRAGELAQLRFEDFEFESMVPHLRIRLEDASGAQVKTVKTPTSIRDVPLALVLMDLGLREFVVSRSKQGTRVFHQIRLGNGRASDGLTKFWLPYLRRFGLWEEGRSTHVWRHTVVACLRANGAIEEDIAAFVGHKRQTTTAGYGGEYPLARKAETLKRLDYGFDVLAMLGGPYQHTKQR